MHYKFPSVQSSCSYACAWRHTAALQDNERTKRRLAQSRSMWHGQRWPRMSRSLCRTVCTVSLLCLESKCLACWVHSYMRPSPTRSCTSISCTSGCQETVGISTCLLHLMDDLRGYLWLASCRTDDAAVNVDALMRLFVVFGVVLLWISDRGSHFKKRGGATSTEGTQGQA
jgi:hypothetical protein